MADEKKTAAIANDKPGMFDRASDWVGEKARENPITTSLTVLAGYDLALKPGAKKVAGMISGAVKGFTKRAGQEVAKEHTRETARGFLGGIGGALNPFRR